MATKLQIRRDTAANWTSANPTLSSGEFGYETDTYKLKIGDGSTAWTSLNYYADQLAGGLDSSEIIGLLSNGSVGHIIPAGNELYDLGDSDNRFRDLYLSGSTLKLGDATLSADSSGALTLPSTIKIGTTTLQATASGVTIGDSGGSILDSAAVLGFINAAYIQSNQITYNTNDFADSAFVTAQINNLIDGAPGTLDTLNEIAAALNDDDSAYNTLLSLINAKTDYDSADTLGLIDSAYIQARQTTSPSGVDSAAVTALIDSAYVQARQTSGGSGTVDSAQVISIINNNTNSGFVWYSYTATQGQTTFQDSDNSGQVLSYDPNGIAVFYNGVLLTPNDFTASDQSSVVLGTAADSGENIAIFKWGVGYTPPEYPWGGGTAVLAGGYTTSNTRTSAMDYITIATPSNTSSFGNLTVARNSAAGVSNITRGVYVGGTTGSNTNVMDYITFASSSNASDFGDTTTANALWMGVSDGTYGVMANGGTINQFTIATAANATAWTGTLTVSRRAGASMNDTTRGVFAGGEGGFYDTIDYITIASDGNATDFGDMLSTRRELGGTSSKNGRGVMNGGTVDGPPYSSNEISYITIQTPSNATDFGDLTTARQTSSSADGTTAVVISSTTSSNVIDYYTIDTLSNATDFGDISSGNKSGIAIASGT